MEISDVSEVKEPVVNVPFDNESITVSNESGYRTKSSEVSVKLKFYDSFLFFYKGRNVIQLN